MRNILFFISFIVFGCHSSEQKNIDYNHVKEPLIDANKNSISIESDQIDAYVKRHKWDVIKTGTGIRYFIYKNGSGEKASEGEMANVSFEISLLDGTVCYTTKEVGSKEFLIGMDNVESGLHEAITYMRVGDKAKIIIPSYLAHGLAGDMNKIPRKSTIVYDLELLSLRKIK